MIDEPEDYYDDDPEEDICIHEDYEIDILTGIASCDDCGARWTATDEQYQHRIDMQAAWDRECARLEAEGLAISDGSSFIEITDDEIPF